MVSSQVTDSVVCSGEAGGVGSMTGTAGIVKLEQVWILFLNSGKVILWSGLRVKILPKMSFSSSDTGRMLFKVSGHRV